MGDSRTTVDRRSFCKYLGGGGLAATGLLSVGSAAASLDDEYGTVVDVADAGAATDGSESVSGVIQDLVDDDTLLRFPPGRYYFDEQVRLTDFRNLGLVGNDATLVPADYWDFDGPQYRMFRLGTDYAPGEDLRIDTFTVDQRAANTGIRAFEACVSDGLVVEHVDVVGEHDSGTWGPGLFTITDPDGEGRVSFFSAPDGAEVNEDTPGDLWLGPTGILCNDAHNGTITFENCVLGGFPDNGLYAAGGDGRVVVEDGVYKNSGVASVRIGAASGAVRNARFVVDENPFEVPQECLRFDYGDWFEVEDVSFRLAEPSGDAIHFQNDVSGGIVRDSYLVMDSPAYVGLAIDPGAGPTYVQDSTFAMMDSNNAVLIESNGDSPGEVGLVNVDVTGNASGILMRHAIRCERDDCYFRDVDVEQHGGHKRRGIALLGDSPFLYNSQIDTSDRSLTVKGDDVWIEDCELLTDTDAEGVRLFDSADGVRLKNNTIPDGVVNLGASDVVETGTEY